MIQVHLNGSKLIPGFNYVAGKRPYNVKNFKEIHIWMH